MRVISWGYVESSGIRLGHHWLSTLLSLICWTCGDTWDKKFSRVSRSTLFTGTRKLFHPWPLTLRSLGLITAIANSTRSVSSSVQTLGCGLFATTHFLPTGLALKFVPIVSVSGCWCSIISQKRKGWGSIAWCDRQIWRCTIKRWFMLAEEQFHILDYTKASELIVWAFLQT